MNHFKDSIVIVAILGIMCVVSMMGFVESARIIQKREIAGTTKGSSLFFKTKTRLCHDGKLCGVGIDHLLHSRRLKSGTDHRFIKASCECPQTKQCLKTTSAYSRTTSVYEYKCLDAPFLKSNITSHNTI